MLKAFIKILIGVKIQTLLNLVYAVEQEKITNLKRWGNKTMKITEYELKSIVLSRVDDLNTCILCDKTDEYLHTSARLSEALTFAIQLNLIEPIKATEIGAKVDAHICRVYGVCHIGYVHWTDKPIKP